MSLELASAYVQIIPSLKGAASTIQKELGGAADSAGDSMSKSLTSKVGAGFTGIAKVAGAAIATVGAAVGGLAVSGGINRALAIDDATAKLRALGYTSKEVTGVMDTSLQAVKGTAFGLGDSVKLAAQLLASGVKPGQDLGRALSVTADMAAVAGVSLDNLTPVMGEMAGKGRMYTQDLMQLASRGLPVFAWLAESMGVTQEKLREMVSKGKVSFEDFQKAVEQHVGGAAKNTDSFNASLSNVKAALGRLGAEAATPSLAILKDQFDKAIPAIDSVTASLKPLINEGFAKLATHAAKIDLSTVVGHLSNLGNMAAPIAGVATGLATLGGLNPILSHLGLSLSPVVAGVGAFLLASKDGRAIIGSLAESAKNLIGPLGNIAKQAGTLSTDLLSRLAPAVQAIGTKLGEVASSGLTIFGRGLAAATPVIGPIVTGVGALATVLTKIPTPVLTAVAAMVGLHAVGVKLSPVFDSVKKSIMEQVAANRAMSDAMGGMSQKAIATQVAVSALGSGIKVLGAAMKTALISTGIGLAVAAVTAGISAIVNKIGEAKRTQQEWQQSVLDLAGTIRAAGGELSQTQWADHWIRQFDDAKKAGNDWSLSLATIGDDWGRVLEVLSSGDMGAQVRLLENWQQKLGDLKTKLAAATPVAQEYSTMTIGYGQNINAAASTITGLTQGQNQYTQAMVAATTSTDDGNNATRAQIAAYENLIDAIDPNIRKIQEAQAVYESTLTATQRYARAVSDLAAALDEAKAAQDRLNGVEVTQLEAKIRAEEATMRAEKAVRAHTEAVKQHGADSIEATTTQWEATRAVLAAADASGEYGNAIAYADGNTIQATRTTAESRTKIAEWSETLGLGTEVVEELTNKTLNYSKGLQANSADTQTNAKANDEAARKFIEGMAQSKLAAEQKANAVQNTMAKTTAYNQTLNATQNELFRTAYQGGMTIDKLVLLAAKAGVAREDFQGLALKAGYSRDQLQGVTDKINAMPARKEIQFQSVGIDAINSQIDNLRHQSITIPVQYSGGGPSAAAAMMRRADGGIVKRFAAGGINTAARIPQIVKGGANILWGEPETGWEAYILGKPSMRLRNLEILEEVAKRFGKQLVPLASGGILGTDNHPPRGVSGAQPGTVVNYYITNPIAEPASVTQNKTLQFAAALGW